MRGVKRTETVWHAVVEVRGQEDKILEFPKDAYRPDMLAALAHIHREMKTREPWDVVELKQARAWEGSRQ